VKSKSFLQINVLERKKECYGEALIGAMVNIHNLVVIEVERCLF
jgi:hypothetical protein